MSELSEQESFRDVYLLRDSQTFTPAARDLVILLTPHVWTALKAAGLDGRIARHAGDREAAVRTIAEESWRGLHEQIGSARLSALLVVLRETGETLWHVDLMPDLRVYGFSN